MGVCKWHSSARGLENLALGSSTTMISEDADLSILCRGLAEPLLPSSSFCARRGEGVALSPEMVSWASSQSLGKVTEPFDSQNTVSQLHRRVSRTCTILCHLDLFQQDCNKYMILNAAYRHLQPTSVSGFYFSAKTRCSWVLSLASFIWVWKIHLQSQGCPSNICSPCFLS